MLLSTRDSAIPIPDEEVPAWVSGFDVAIKISVFMATLVVYDACKYFYPASIHSFVRGLISISIPQLSHLIAR